MIGTDRPEARRRIMPIGRRLLLAIPVAVLAMLLAHHIYAAGWLTIGGIGIASWLMAAETLRALTTDDGL